MKTISLFFCAALVTILATSVPLQGSSSSQGCSNGAPNPSGPPGPGQDPSPSDPFVVYSGNEYRHVPDLKVWGGVGEHQLTFGRWANSRFVSGQQYFGDGHNWRHEYQWEMADAGLSSSGAAQVEIIYPEGQDNTFTQNSTTSTTWNPRTAIEDTLFQSTGGNDFYLQRKDGFRYHFQKDTDLTGAVYYLMTDFTDSQMNDYTLTYNAAHEVTQVTEPGGRFLQINYSTVNLSKTDFNTFATIATQPTDSQYTEITVTDPHAYRYLRYLGPDDGYCDVAEVEFYDTNGNKLSGTPFGALPAWYPGRESQAAFDGDVNTWYEYAQMSGGFCGIDLGAGNSAVVGKVRFYPRIGLNWRMIDASSPWFASAFGKFQGCDEAPQTLPVISSVSTSDGRTVTYNYSTFADANTSLPFNYKVLSGVTYDDSTQASLTYSQVMPSTRPLVTTYVEPRYEMAFTKSSTAYFGEIGSSLGQISSQNYYNTPYFLYSLSSQDWHTPQVYTWGSGGTRVYSQDGTTGQNMAHTDALGRVDTQNYDSNGFQASITNPRGATIRFNRSAFNHPLGITLADGSQRTYTRDSLDLPLSAQDELGNRITISRDASHRMIARLNPDSSSESLTYNSFSQPLIHQLRNGATESAAYDSTGLKTSSTDALGHVTTYTYDSAGRVASVTDARSNTTLYQYDARGHFTLITYPDTSTHSYSYDMFGNKLTDTDELGHTTTRTYDLFNRCTSITDALGNQTQYIFRGGYYITKPDEVILPSGKVTFNSYDMEANLVSQTVGYGTADAATTSYTYDGNDNVLTTTDPNGHVWSYAYDSRDRKTSQTDPLGHTTAFTYDAASNVHTITRPDGGVTTNVYDSMHRLTQTTNPKGEVTSMTYDASGNLLTTTDARSNTYTYTYDLLNRKTSLKYPDNSIESYAYDSVGNLTNYVTRAGQTKTSTFDNRNREVSYTWSDGVTPNVSRSYDGAGRLLTSANGVSTSTYAYDSANRLLSETDAIAGLGSSLQVAYVYNADGNCTNLTYPSSTAVTYGYTGRNKIGSISIGGTSLAGYTYDGNNNIVSKTLGNGTVATYTYDGDNRLTTLNHTISGMSFARFDYGYDNVNRRTFEQRDSATGDIFGYDAVDQVASVNYEATNPTSGTSGAFRTIGYAYDATGNRTAVNDSVNGNVSYSANNLNQYTSVGGVAYGSDTNGNLISGSGLYFYDAQNRLTYAQKGSDIVQLAYDSKNRVVKRTVNGISCYFIYDSWDLIEERDSSSAVLATYVHGVRQDELLSKKTSSGTVFYHQNALGSVTDLTNASGSVVEKYKYDAFGAPLIFDGSGTALTTSAYSNRFLFTGREYIAQVDLYDYRNRMYSAGLGRFLQTDPIRFNAGDVNIYRYCGNNSVNKGDALGLTPPMDANGNFGTGNTGHGNIGNNNTGDNNIGNNNTGDGNIGNQNNGNGNEGNQNNGSSNFGNLNNGNNNIGNNNHGPTDPNGNPTDGNNNVGNNNTGCHNKGSNNFGNYNNGTGNNGNNNNGTGNNGNNNNGYGNNGNNNNGTGNNGSNNNGSFNNGSNNNQWGSTGNGGEPDRNGWMGVVEGLLSGIL